MKDQFEMLIFNIFKKFILIFPLKLRYKIAEVFGIFGYLLIRSRRELTFNNLKIAFPEKDLYEIKRIAINSYKNIAKTFFELLWAEDLKIELVGLEYLNALREQKRGIILVSLHLGNWESGGMKLGKEFNIPFYPIARKQRNKLFDDELNKQRQKLGIYIIHKGASTSPRLIIKALKNNGVLALICDQYGKDLTVDFFNKTTYAVSGPALLSLKFDVPVVFAYDIRVKNEYHKVIIKPEIKIEKTENTENDIKNGMQKIFNEFESVIKENPEQWFWQHKRWR